ncbi:fungal-specific transcription factor domain-containing protein [Aspergillus avenaceus]|uniref:Fungal-specific transcription factor domain-containing protein n=1 Tax=Aspergillus avenaceus TaxID=36643 RepID=A0A5N6TXV6_ASPAV|nr:fungal-specific transcription factor domain-containing protein [Aspergillus avenaceus]
MIHNILARNEPMEQSPGPHRRKRKAVNCEECRRSKLRCDRQHPCSACKRRKRESSCLYEIPSGVPVSTRTQKLPVTAPASTTLSSGVESPSTSARRNFASALVPQPEPSISEPDQASLGTHWEVVLERPAPGYDVHDTLSPLSIGPRISLQVMIDSLPPRSCCDYLISHFFKNVSVLFPILHGPTFQKQYTAFMQRPHDVDLSWLALLFSLCSLALSTLDESDPRLASFRSQLPSSPTRVSGTAFVTVSMPRRLLRTAMTCLLQDNFFIRHKFSIFEALLIVIYTFTHNETVDQGWALLGMALNIGIALRCNVDQSLSPIETERRRRCWAGLLTLHTYQGILFRDVDMSYLLKINAPLPADVNDSDITENGIFQPSSRSEPTQMSVMMAKLRLFRLSTQICRHISGPSRLDQRSLHEFDAAIAEEQKQWDSIYMVDGSLNILDSNSYAYWCILQTYAHPLYLLLHRPFHHSKSACFLPRSRERCISSGMELISIHRQLYEAPLLRNYLWLLSGVTSLKALHAAVALNSCIQDTPSVVDLGHDLNSFREEIENLVTRVKDLSGQSNICLRAYRILRHLQAQAGTGNLPTENLETPFEDLFENWTDIREWMDSDLINWTLNEPSNVFAP